MRLSAGIVLVVCAALLGICASVTLGASQDAAALRAAAEQGEAEAQYRLGLAYQRGDGVPRNRAEGARWLELAADQGHVEAQN
ncbi:MAG: SEL1-like repeat protein, partial [Acidobacteriota bacterium]|nr:SEL1-like repeat protein [Acidobacteriota bacterium]